MTRHPVRTMAGAVGIGVVSFGASAQVEPDYSSIIPPDPRITPAPAPVVNPEAVSRVLGKGDARVLVMGDSFSLPSWSRVFPAVLRVWDYPVPTAVVGGASRRSDLLIGSQIASPSEVIDADPGTGYEMYRGDETRQAIYSLPVRGIHSFRLDESLQMEPGNPSLYRMYAENLDFRILTDENFFEEGESFAFRTLVWADPDPSVLVGSVDVRADSGEAMFLRTDRDFRASVLDGGDPFHGPGVAVIGGHVNASASDLVVEAGSQLGFSVGPSATDLGTGAYFHAAGGVLYKVNPETGRRVRGLYYGSLSGSSWSYRGFGEDTEATIDDPKVYSTEQLARWLEATTLDPTQPLVVFYYLAAESIGSTQMIEEAEGMVGKTEAAAAMVGIESVTHAFVVPHFHLVAGTNELGSRQRVELQRNGMMAFARSRENVACFSIYDATNGVLLDGGEQAIEWLVNSGDAFFRYGPSVVRIDGGVFDGRLLDGPSVHPRSDTNIPAAYYATKLAELIAIPGSPVDINGDGTVDIRDLYDFWSAPRDLDFDDDTDSDDYRALERYVRRGEIEDLLTRPEPDPRRDPRGDRE